jgi:predicted esterase
LNQEKHIFDGIKNQIIIFMLKFIFVFTLFVSIISGCRSDAPDGSKHVQALKSWLEEESASGSSIEAQPFAHKELSMDNAMEAAGLIHDHFDEKLRVEYADQWNEGTLVMGNKELKFGYKKFGEKPSGGWSLYISMHGGGGTSQEMNDRQWQNQIGLYRPREGIYMAPRAPDNSWNMWHQYHVDSLFGLFIQLADVFEGINTNRVYLTGYSAGGDGTYQLAPRMADRLAAAAMMAGHPNDASPVSLRNLPFALHMGALDAAYNRNQVAVEWGGMLDELQRNDPEGYVHDVQIHEGLGHWMERRDTVAIEWMAQFERNPYPEKIVWNQNGKVHSGFYWLGLAEESNEHNAVLVVSRNGQDIHIEQAEHVKKLHIYLNDEMVDLNQKVRVHYNGAVIYDARPKRTVAALWNSMNGRNDREQLFFSEIEVSL